MSLQKSLVVSASDATIGGVGAKFDALSRDEIAKNQRLRQKA